jgi:hypothetical protein
VQLIEGKKFWESLKKPDIEERLSEAVNTLVPQVMHGIPCQQLLDIVEKKVKEVLGCLLPSKNELLIGKVIVGGNKCLLQLWMCPSWFLCGKSGDSPTGRFCKDIDHVVMQGK